MGFSINAEYPSRFIRGEEILKPVDLVISSVKKEESYNPITLKKEPTLVIYFEKISRGVRLGKQRARDISSIHGDNTDMWIQKPICMYSESKNMKGGNKMVIRFRSTI